MASIKRKEKFTLELNRFELDVVREALSSKAWNDVARRTTATRTRDLIDHALG